MAAMEVLSRSCTLVLTRLGIWLEGLETKGDGNDEILIWGLYR